MTKEKLKQLLCDKREKSNTTEIAVEYINHASEPEKSELTDELITEMSETEYFSIMNRIAGVLSGVKCQKAVKPLIRLIIRPDIRPLLECDGTLLCSLKNLDYAEYLSFLLPLFFCENSPSVRMHIYSLIESCRPEMSEETRRYCLHYMRTKIEVLEEMLGRGYDVYENILNGEPLEEMGEVKECSDMDLQL